MDARGSPTASSWHTVLSSSASQTDGVLRDAVHFYQKSSSTTDDFDIPLMGYRLPQASPGNTNNKGDAQNILRSFNDLRRAWKWEIFTLLVGMYALCDIIVLLALYRNQPTSEWKLKLELGTAIAVLSQVAHSAFLVPVAACIGQLKWNWLQDRASKTGQAATAIDIRRFDEATRGPWGSLLLLLKIRQL